MTSPSGLLLIDKPQGWTSHDVVTKLRRLLGERRIGHAGTLDPMATGLLVVAVGPATRLLRFAQAETKHYSGAVRFGVATDSLDADGVVTATMPVPHLDVAAVNKAAATFMGEIEQVPPMVSAIKIGGRRLHEIAREGGEVDRPSRRVTVSAFSLTPTNDTDVWRFDVTCTTGTYVRVLLFDLAQTLKTTGHLVELRRERSGSHEVGDAWSLEDLALAVEAGESVVAAPLQLVDGLPRVALNEEQATAVGHGKRLSLDESFATDEIAAIDGDGALVAVLRRREDQWQPDVVLAAT